MKTQATLHYPLPEPSVAIKKMVQTNNLTGLVAFLWASQDVSQEDVFQAMAIARKMGHCEIYALLESRFSIIGGLTHKPCQSAKSAQEQAAAEAAG